MTPEREGASWWTKLLVVALVLIGMWIWGKMG
jgi:hypothetical protein